MLRREDAYEKDARVDAGDTFSEGRAVRIPKKSLPSKKRRPTKPAPLAPDAKRYNDEIPDPDAEDAIPEAEAER